MKIPFLKKSGAGQAKNVEAVNLEEEDEMSSATKIKVVAALLVVGIATYVAYWVQEPSQIRADVLEGTASQEPALLAQADDLVDSANQPENSMEGDLILTEDDLAEDKQLIAQAMEDDGIGLKQEEIDIIDFTFSPTDITVEEGTVVIWTNNDTVPHTVTTESFSSGTLNPGDSFSYTFDRTGRFDYTCSFHPQMGGTINVQPQGSMNTLIQEMAQQEDENLLTLDIPEELPEMMPLQLEGMDMESQSIATATPQSDGSLTKSGPEDLLYLVLFGAVLWWQRKKFFPKR